MPDNPPTVPTEVLIAHPEEAQRGVIRRALDGRSGVRVVAVTGNDAEAADAADLLRPAVVLIDDRITTPAGIEALAHRSRVILLTGETEPHVVAGLLHEPARGYLIYDNFEPGDLLGAVLAVARGLAWLSPLAASAAAEEMRLMSRRGSDLLGPAEHLPDEA